MESDVKIGAKNAVVRIWQKKIQSSLYLIFDEH